MSQIDMTTGSGAGRFESVRPDGDVRPATRITPQVMDPARPVDPAGKARAHVLTEDYRAPVPPVSRELDPADIAALHAALTKGTDGLARKRDLGDMHRQTVKLFQTLNEGLGEQQRSKAAEDRNVLIARMERLENSVNAMEGAVRIEMVPLLRNMLNEALAAQVVRQSPRSRRGLWLAMGLTVGVVLGGIFAADIAPGANGLADRAMQTAARMMGR